MTTKYSKATSDIYNICERIERRVNLGAWPNTNTWRCPALIAPLIPSECVYISFQLVAIEDLKANDDNYSAYICVETKRVFITEGGNHRIDTLIGETTFKELVAALNADQSHLPTVKPFPWDELLSPKIKSIKLNIMGNLNIHSEGTETFETEMSFEDLLEYTDVAVTIPVISDNEVKIARENIYKWLDDRSDIGPPLLRFDLTHDYSIKLDVIEDVDTYLLNYLPINAKITEGFAYILAFKQMLSNYVELFNGSVAGGNKFNTPQLCLIQSFMTNHIKVVYKLISPPNVVQ